MGWLLRDIRKIKNIVSDRVSIVEVVTEDIRKMKNTVNDRVSIVGVVTEGHQKNEEYC